MRIVVFYAGSAIGRPGHIDVECLEDTGSSNCTLYKGDLLTLGIHPGNYGFWLNPISVQVVGGTVLLRRVMLSLQVLSQGAGSEPIGGVFLDECLAMQELAARRGYQVWGYTATSTSARPRMGLYYST